MKLTDLFSGRTQYEGTVQSGQEPKSRAALANEISRQIRALVPGQTLHGEIVGRNGGEVQVRLAEDMILNARVDQNIYLELGKDLTFEVKNNGATLTLSPLFTNVATDGNIIKALEMAGLPVQEKTVEMTKQLMDSGLPIHKAALQQVFREWHAFMEEGKLADIINLHKLNLPVNRENVEQMASYRNLTYQLNQTVDDITEQLSQVLDTLTEEGKTQEAENLLGRILELAGETEGEQAEAGQAASKTGQTEAGQAASKVGQTEAGQAASETGQPETGRSAQEAGQEGAIQAAMEAGQTESGKKVSEAGQTEARRIISEGVESETLNTAPEDGQIKGQISGAGQQEATALAKESGTTLKQALAAVREQLTANWSITPEELEEAEKLGEFYKKFARQLNGLAKALEEAGQADSGAGKAVMTASRNVDFMQQINQMYAYVQLPLKFGQERAHGDLYVYTNRKNLSTSGEGVSALLHLDMENLGPLDVYVKLQEARVSTKFYVRDEETLDFLEAHMDILTKRLADRGYSCECSAMTREGEEELQDKGLKPLLEQEKSMVLSHYAFDVRT